MGKIWMEITTQATPDRTAVIMSDIMTDLIELDEVVGIEGTVEGFEDDAEEASIID